MYYRKPNVKVLHCEQVFQGYLIFYLFLWFVPISQIKEYAARKVNKVVKMKSLWTYPYQRFPCGVFCIGSLSTRFELVILYLKNGRGLFLLLNKWTNILSEFLKYTVHSLNCKMYRLWNSLAKLNDTFSHNNNSVWKCLQLQPVWNGLFPVLLRQFVLCVHTHRIQDIYLSNWTKTKVK